MPSSEAPIEGVTESGDIRKIVWQGAIELWKQYPILGTGVENFAYSYYDHADWNCFKRLCLCL